MISWTGTDGGRYTVSIQASGSTTAEARPSLSSSRRVSTFTTATLRTPTAVPKHTGEGSRRRTGAVRRVLPSEDWRGGRRNYPRRRDGTRHGQPGRHGCSRARAGEPALPGGLPVRPGGRSLHRGDDLRRGSASSTTQIGDGAGGCVRADRRGGSCRQRLSPAGTRGWVAVLGADVRRRVDRRRPHEAAPGADRCARGTGRPGWA